MYLGKYHQCILIFAIPLFIYILKPDYPKHIRLGMLADISCLFWSFKPGNRNAV